MPHVPPFFPPPLSRVLLALLVLGGSCSRAPQVRETTGDVIVSNGRLHYRIVGQGPDTILVLHGGPGLHSSYLYDAFDSLALSHVVVYYDQRGLGASSAAGGKSDSTQYTVAQEVADLDGLRRALSISHVTLAAHHFGAVLAALYARRFPAAVQRLLLVSPSFPTAHYLFWASTEPNDQRVTAAYLRALGAGRDTTDPKGFCRRYWGFLLSPIEVTEPGLVHYLAGPMCDGDPAALRRAWQINRLVANSLHGFDLRDSVRAIRAPTLVLRGVMDTATVEGTRAWASAIPGAREVDLSSPGPFPWIGGRAEFFGAVVPFLEGRWPAAALPAVAVSR